MKLFAFTIFTIVFLFFSESCFAWGHLEFLNNDWGKASLTHVLISKNEITFCVKVEDPYKFPPIHISAQVKNALEVWLSAAGEYSNGKILEVPCESRKANLVVHVGTEKEFTEMSAYQVPLVDKDHYYSFIKLNTDYTYVEGANRFKVVDFAQMIPIPYFPTKVMKEVSEKKPMNVGDFSAKFKIHYQKAYLSSYKMLLHEIGHSFGLCDTEEELFKYCDSKYRTSDRPPSIMNQADFFYLTQDDREGMKALLNRFRNSQKTKN